MSAFVSLNELQMTQRAEIFLKNDPNKAQFISILSEELRKGHDVGNSIWDADTQIVSVALEYTAGSDKDVVVLATDTDILVMFTL